MDEMRIDRVEEEVQAENNAQETAAEQKGKGSFIKKIFAPKKRKKTIAILAVIVIVIGTAIGIFQHFSPGNVAERFAEALEMENEVQLQSLVAYDRKKVTLGVYGEEKFFEKASDEYYAEIKNWKDYSKYKVKQKKEWMEDVYGEYKCSYEVSRIRDMSVNKVNDVCEKTIRTLEINYGFDKDIIKDAKEVSVKAKIQGEDSVRRGTYTVYVVKVGALWKVLDHDYDYD